MMRRLAWPIALLAACAASRGAEAVRVHEGSRKILTGPFKLKGPSPQERLGEFNPVAYPAVYVENEYLRCCVLPTVGGRLYEVYNKASKSQLFFVNPYLDAHANNYEGGHPWNLGGVEVNFPYFHHGNTYNDRWSWAKVERPDGSAGVALGFTSRPTMQRAAFRVLLRPGAARVDLEYRFENLNPYSWGLAAWIDTMHPKTMETEFILPSPWVAQHGHNASRTDLKPWPVRDGIDLSWQKNLVGPHDLSEFAFMPRKGFHGCYDHAADRGAVRIFDPKTLPAAKLWTQALPVSPERYYQHFEIWTATSAVMEDPGWQPALSACAAADAWFQAWGIGGYVAANADAALNLARRPDGAILAGVCGARRIPGCVAVVRSGQETLLREPFDLDPARPWRKETAAPAGDVAMEVLGPDGVRVIACELPAREMPQEDWKMPEKPRWRDGLNAARYEEIYSTLWRRRGHFLDGAIHRYKDLLKKEPKSAALMLDLARAHLKDEQVRIGSAYPTPGPDADADAARRREADLASATGLLREAIAIDPAQGHARLYLGLALERQGKTAEAMAEYRAALACTAPAPAAGMLLARLLSREKPAEALALARRAAAVYPQSARAKQTLMAALAAAGKPAEAIAVGRGLVEADPSDPVAAMLLGVALGLDGKADEAQACRREAERLCGDDAQAQTATAAEVAWVLGIGR